MTALNQINYSLIPECSILMCIKGSKTTGIRITSLDDPSKEWENRTTAKAVIAMLCQRKTALVEGEIDLIMFKYW
jgi:hypothetical protein